MARLQFLLQQLRSFAAYTLLNPGDSTCPTVVDLLDSQTHLTADRLYMGTPADLDRLGTVTADLGAALILADASGYCRPQGVPDGCEVLCFTCPLPLVYNTLVKTLRLERQWQEVMLKQSSKGDSIQGALSAVFTLSGRPALLLDQYGRVLVSAGMEKSAYLTEQVSISGVVPMQTIQQVLTPDLPTGHVGVWSIPQTEIMVCAQRIEIADSSFRGIVLMEGRQDALDLDLQSLCSDVARHLRKSLTRNLDDLPLHDNAFAACWARIMDNRLSNSEEIRQALSDMAYPLKDFVRVAVITFAGDGKGVPFNYFLIRLQEIFPKTNMTIYHKNIVLLLSDDERDLSMSFYEPRLQELLVRYNGFFAIGSQTRRLEGLSACFRLSLHTVLLGQALRFDENERIFHYERYSMYYVIDLSVRRFLEMDGNRDPLYLIHPAVVLLTRYDTEHNSNLRDVLFYYLLNERNLVKTAAASFMHRNTVINKVNKIEELINLDLDDPYLRQRLIFSCQFIRYQEKVMLQEFRP